MDAAPAVVVQRRNANALRWSRWSGACARAFSTAEVAEDPELDQRFRAGPLLLESSVFSWPPLGHRPSALLIRLRVYQVVAHFGFEHDEESCGGCNAEACSFPCVSPPGGGSSDCRGSKFPQEAMPFYCSELRSKGAG